MTIKIGYGIAIMALGWLLAILGLLGSVQALVNIELRQRLDSLTEAVNTLEYCYDEGNTHCQIELDGREYHVYGSNSYYDM